MQAVEAPATPQEYGSRASNASGAHELRAKLRAHTESDREKRCGVVAVRDTGPSIEAKGQPGAWSPRWCGVLTCGHIWTCPTCSERLRRERRAKVERAVSTGGGRWQMLTLTVRHYEGMPLRSLARGLMQAWRRTRQGGATQRIWAERVKASVRAAEITRGSHGWHPHLHVLLHTDGFSEAEQATLLERWLVCVERELGPACVPSREHALKWSTPIDWCAAKDKDRVRYLVKLGLELSGPKEGRRGSLTHWDIARLATEGDTRAQEWWREFYRATKGRRMVELDDRAAAYARKPLPLLAFDVNVAEPLDAAPAQVVSIPVDTLELRALRQYEARDPSILAVIMADVAKSQDPRAVVRAWIDHVCRCLRYTVPNGRKEESEARGRARGDPQGDEQARDGPSWN
jgi:hypothetical protein